MKKNPFFLSLLLSGSIISTMHALQPVHVEAQSSNQQNQSQENMVQEESQEFQILAAYYQMIHQICGGEELVAVETDFFNAMQDYLIVAVDFKQAQEVTAEQEQAMDAILGRCQESCKGIINYFARNEARFNGQLSAMDAAKLMLNVHMLHAIPVFAESDRAKNMVKTEQTATVLMEALQEIAMFLSPLFN